jgi:hypothetical protein
LCGGRGPEVFDGKTTDAGALMKPTAGNGAGLGRGRRDWGESPGGESSPTPLRPGKSGGGKNEVRANLPIERRRRDVICADHTSVHAYHKPLARFESLWWTTMPPIG